MKKLILFLVMVSAPAMASENWESVINCDNGVLTVEKRGDDARITVRDLVQAQRIAYDLLHNSNFDRANLEEQRDGLVISGLKFDQINNPRIPKAMITLTYDILGQPSMLWKSDRFSHSQWAAWRFLKCPGLSR